MAAALRSVKRFRLQELSQLKDHIRRFGPLPAVELTSSGLKPKLLPNPFIPRLNPNTGRWAPPKYSLRRQAELIKKAKESNTLQLLPPGPKLFNPTAHAERLNSPISLEKPSTPPVRQESWLKPVVWEGKFVGKAVPGADIGNRLYASKKRMFKGHKWERVKEARDKKHAVLMRDMAKRVKSFKTYHRRKRPDPLKPARSAKAAKLPF